MQTNSLKFSEYRTAKDGRQFKIEISLNDDCENGHQDFHIVGDVWQANKPKIDKYWLMGCSIGEEITKEFPEYGIFDKLHGCDYSGAPSYAVGNGYYFMTTDTKETTMQYLRINENEYNQLILAGDEQHFCLLLESLYIVKRWKEEADRGIKFLEQLTGNEFVNDSQKSQFIPLTDEQKTDAQNKINSGYYSADEITKRAIEAKKAKKNKIITELKEQAEKDIQKIKTKLDLALMVVNCDIDKFNFIYYNHTNTVVFNWNVNSSEKAITKEQFNEFLSKVDYTLLPEGIIFKMKSK